MRGTWKSFLTGSAIGLALGGYIMSRMREGRGSGRDMPYMSNMTDRAQDAHGKIGDTMAGIASQAAEKLDDLSLRARTLNRRIEN